MKTFSYLTQAVISPNPSLNKRLTNKFSKVSEPASNSTPNQTINCLYKVTSLALSRITLQEKILGLKKMSIMRRMASWKGVEGWSC